jgi:hypothetical protein
VNEWDGGRVIVIGVDVVGFVDIQDVRSRVERGCAPMEGWSRLCTTMDTTCRPSRSRKR